MMRRREQRELLEAMLAASADDLTDAQAARFSQLVVQDDGLAWYAAQILSQQAWLCSHSAVSCVGVESNEQRETIDWLAEMSSGAVEAPCVALSETNDAAFERERHLNQVQRQLPGIWSSWRGSSWLTPTMAAALLLIGAVVGWLATRWDFSQGQDRVAAVHVVPPAAHLGGGNVPFSPYAARFVQGTACVWGPGTVPPNHDGGRVRSGESINLMEGLAEIKVDLATGGDATLQIEGPARMFLTADGFPSLTLGKFTAMVHPGFGDFALETPFGQVFVEEESSLGIAVHGLEVEVHVFSGAVEVASPWTSGLNKLERFAIGAGKSFRLTAADGTAMTFTRGVADPASFASQMTMVSDRLRIPTAYVDAVKRAGPLVYWRFEDASDGKIRNEVGKRFQGVVVGSPSWSIQDGNRAIEFGTSLTDNVLQDCVEATDPFGDLMGDSYTVELWLKPSHYHLGTLVSFVRNEPSSTSRGDHGMLLELGGPLITPSTIEHPGRIRFLHRDPPSSDPTTGTSVFSRSPYELRKWAYVVAKKDGPDMRLYVNGQQVAEAEDPSKLSGGLTVLIGQLDRYRNWRPFVGQLDELAIYSRALGDDEIRHHYELVRPPDPPRDAI